MFARRFRVLLKIRDQSSFLRLSARDYVGPNLRFSSIASVKPIELYSLKRSCFSTQKIESYSHVTQSSKHEATSEYSDDDETNNEQYKVRMTENRRAYTVLQSSERYSKTIVPPIIPDETFADEIIEKILLKDWSNSTVSELIESFRILSYHARSNNKQFTDRHIGILQELNAISKDILTDQIWLLLKYLEMWYPMPRTIRLNALSNFEDTLDHECWKRSVDWDANDLLMTCDMFYHLRRAKQSKFVGSAIKRLGLKPNKMSSDNYPHYMYLLSVGRTPSINIYELEYRLETIVEEFNAEELAIIAMGFFKTETPIRNPALSGYIIQKCVDNMATLDEIFISAVMKMARHSIHLRDREILRTLFRRFAIRVDTTSTTCLVQTAHSGATTLIYEKNVMDAIINKLLEKGLVNARLKDIERLLLCLMMFNYPKEFPLYQLAVDQLRNPVRTTERKKFAVTYACSLMYLAHAGIYPLDIISTIMDPEYLREVYRNNAFKVGREYLTLECGLKVDVPEYKGPFLPERIYNFLAKKYASGVVWREDPSTRTQTYHKFLSEVLHYLKTIVGENNFFLDQILPQHQRADIILCMDADNNFIPPEPMLTACPRFKLKFAPEPSKNYKWFAVVLLSYNHLFRGSTLMSGTTNAKLRHLEIAGYTPITVTLTAWLKLRDAERLEYLQKLIIDRTMMNKKNLLS